MGSEWIVFTHLLITIGNAAPRHCDFGSDTRNKRRCAATVTVNDRIQKLHVSSYVLEKNSRLPCNFPNHMHGHESGSAFFRHVMRPRFAWRRVIIIDGIVRGMDLKRSRAHPVIRWSLARVKRPMGFKSQSSGKNCFVERGKEPEHDNSGMGLPRIVSTKTT